MQDRRKKIEFQSNNTNLSGLLETPSHNIKGYVLFAHCFTCGKDIAAAARIARALVARGYAVLRFDFTGIGASEVTSLNKPVWERSAGNTAAPLPPSAFCRL